MSLGSDLLESTCSHPQLGTLTFYHKADEDVEADLGGYTNNDDDSEISGNGIPMQKMNRKRWSHTLGVILWEKVPSDTLANLQALSNSTVEGSWTFTTVDGGIYQGQGKPVGDIKGNRNTGAISGIKISGGGVLEQIA